MIRLHPDIAALRGDPALQHAAQERLEAALADWRAACGMGEVERELAAYAEGSELGDRLAALFWADDAPATALVGNLVRLVSAAMSEQPLGHLSLRHAQDAAAATLVLARCGAAALSLQVLDGAALRPPATTAVFQPAQSVARVLGGFCTARLAQAGSAGKPPVVSPVTLHQGQVFRCDGQREALLIDQIDGQLLMLKLQRRSSGLVPACEVDLASGTLLRQAAASPRDSRLELATALLGRMKRADAAPLLAALAQERGSPQLRWHALRECLALDSAAGFAALTAVAADLTDQLAAPATTLRAQLLVAHPELELALCPA